MPIILLTGVTSSVFEDYLHNWDRQPGKKRKKTALVLDNCPSHLPQLTVQ
jgi:hypothetical protein